MEHLSRLLPQSQHWQFSPGSDLFSQGQCPRNTEPDFFLPPKQPKPKASPFVTSDFLEKKKAHLFPSNPSDSWRGRAALNPSLARWQDDVALLGIPPSSPPATSTFSRPMGSTVWGHSDSSSSSGKANTVLLCYQAIPWLYSLYGVFLALKTKQTNQK